MGNDPLARLQYAISATKFGGGQRTVAAKARASGLRAFEQVFDVLQPAERQYVEDQAEELFESGIEAVLLGQEGYPDTLAASRQAPAAVFFRGPIELFTQRAIGVCGSRQASAEGLRASYACSDTAARRGYCVVSGYAKGVDLAAHSAALAAGGTTVIVLAEGINRFRIRRGEFSELWNPARALVVSQFAPDQKWFASGAMTRNAVISDLSRALVVVEAGDRGGTLAAGEYALQRRQLVLALQLFDAPPGNKLLIANGAKVIRSRQHLEAALDYLDRGESFEQLTLM